MSFVDTVFAFLPRLRRPDGGLADAQCDANGALRVALVRETTPSSTFLEPERGVPLTGTRLVPGTTGRRLRRVHLANAGPALVWVQLFDLPRVPGAAAQPFLSLPLPTNGFVADDVSRALVDGLAWGASTSPGTFTPATGALVWGAFELEPA